MPDSHGGALRRVPEQARSAQRFDLILDTTAALIDEVGYGSITISLIAKRAQMSGPGIYRYFDGVEAIVTALATRNMQLFVAKAVEMLSDSVLTWPDAVKGSVEVYAELFRSEPGFRWLGLGDPVDRNLLNSTETNKSVLARQVARLFVDRFDVWYRPDLISHANVIVEIADGLLLKAFESDRQGDQFYIDECARVIIDYLGSYLERTLPADGSQPWPEDQFPNEKPLSS